MDTMPNTTAAATDQSWIGPSSDPYQAILEFAEHELQLARDGRIEDLRSLAPPVGCAHRRPPRAAAHLRTWPAGTRGGAARAYERHAAVPARGAAVRPAHHRARQSRRPRLRQPGSPARPPHGPQRVAARPPRRAMADYAGSSSSASTCRGRMTEKWRWSSVASFGSRRRSTIARTAASTKPTRRSA